MKRDKNNMAHPFTKILYKALSKSSREDNLVLQEAEKLKEKGYSLHEIYGVLEKLRKGLIENEEIEIVEEALEEFEEYLEE